MCNTTHPVVGADHRPKCKHCGVPLELVRHRSEKTCLACEKKAENGLCLTCGSPLHRIQDTGRTRCATCGVPPWPENYVDVVLSFAGKTKTIVASPHARVYGPKMADFFLTRLGPLARRVVGGCPRMRVREVDFYRGGVHEPVYVRGLTLWPCPWEESMLDLDPTTLHVLWDISRCASWYFGARPAEIKWSLGVLLHNLGCPGFELKAARTWKKLGTAGLVGSDGFLCRSVVERATNIAFPEARTSPWTSTSS